MDHLQHTYRECFSGSEPEYHVFSPYSVCPLGAHVDHQHGIVTGFALDKGIDLLFSSAEDGRVEMLSTRFAGEVSFSVRSQVGQRENNWGDYLRAALWAMQQKYSLTVGIRGVVGGTIPSGGIASSAALLCGFIMSLAKVNHLELDRMQLIDLAAKAEQSYIGLKNGILDHACVTLSKANQLLLLDTDKLSILQEPFSGSVSAGQELPFKVAVFFSGVSRSLIYTDYNQRVQECRVAADILQAYEDDKGSGYEENVLRRVKPTTFEKYASQMPPRYARRARHFFSECERVQEGLEAWQQGDVEQFGELMFESCESSILNYECGSPQLIAIYRSLRNTPGVYGARFCGAGFIGSCFALIDPSKEDAIREKVLRDYLQQFPMYKDSFRTFICESHDGVAFVDF
jgi:galactokinase